MTIFSHDSRLARADQLDTHALSTRDVMRRIMRDYIWPHKSILAISFVALVFVALTTSAIPLLIQRVSDDLFVNRLETALYTLPLMIAGIMALKGLSEYIAANTEAFVAYRIVADMRVQIFEALTSADLRWIQGVHSGRLHSSFLHDTEIVRDSAARVLVALGKNLLKAVVLLGNMIYLNWQLSIAMLVMLPVAALFLGRQRKKMRSETKKTMARTADMATLLSETLDALRIVKAFGMEKQEVQRISQTIDAAFHHRVQSIRIRSASSPVTETIVGLGLALAIYAAGLQGISGSLTVGEFMGFLTAAMLLYQPLRSLAVLQTALQEGVSAANRIFTILDHVPNIKEANGAGPIAVSHGAVAFKDVEFSYTDDQALFSGLNLQIAAGSRVALVGPSGSGKTTLFNLIMRFYDPDKGQVLIDGNPIDQATLSSVRKASALLTQDPILFDASIQDNISYGANTIEADALWALLEDVGLSDFVKSLPEGVETIVGEGGESLSGGQRQRIALARALNINAPILLLDEPTSALDAETETIIQSTLERLHGRVTVIIIAHRLATIRNADQIHVLQAGQLCESGTHETLMALSGRYYDMTKAQPRV